MCDYFFSFEKLKKKKITNRSVFHFLHVYNAAFNTTPLHYFIVIYVIWMIWLTILDVLHIKMNAGHQNSYSLRTLVVQELHHLSELMGKRPKRTGRISASYVMA